MQSLFVCSLQENTTSGSVCSFVKYGGDEYTLYLQAFQLFMLFWSANFVVALGQMTLAGAVASYYWAFNKPKDVPALPLFSSLKRTLRYVSNFYDFYCIQVIMVFDINIFYFIKILIFVKLLRNQVQCYVFVFH